MSDQTNSPSEIPPLDLSGGSKYIVPEAGIGERIKEARTRKDNDLSVEALSRMCKLRDPEQQGISRTTLLRYESGTILPGAREIRILCDALDVTPDWLFGWRPTIHSIDLDESLGILAEIIRDRAISKNPLAHTASSPDVVRSMMLLKAKEPTKR